MNQELDCAELNLLLLMREIDGRVEEEQAMNRNSVMVYEPKNLKVLDPRELSKEEGFMEVRKCELKNLKYQP